MSQTRTPEHGTGTPMMVRDAIVPGRPLRVAALVKQVPIVESMKLGADGRLDRSGPVEINPYCRRAVSKAVEVARVTAGHCTIFTLGPPQAEDALREAVAWGADEGIHLCDPAFEGSDTLATARALSLALQRKGPFDLVLVGRNTIDGDTGQVGPEVASLLDLPFATGVRHLTIDHDLVVAALELDDGWETVELQLPALLSVAERLCEPAKVDAEGRRAVPADRFVRLSAMELGPGPWGQAGSPTRVGSVRTLQHRRAGQVLTGDVEDQVLELVRLLEGHGALGDGAREHLVPHSTNSMGTEETLSADGTARDDVVGNLEGSIGAPLVVVAEPGRPAMTGELLGAALELRASTGLQLVVLGPEAAVREAPEQPVVDLMVALRGQLVAEDVAAALTAWANRHNPWVVLAPSTAFGREVAGRAAAALGAGLVGDAIGVELTDAGLIAAKPALSGSLVADISCVSRVQLVTLRPGVLAAPATTSNRSRNVAPPGGPPVEVLDVSPRGRITVLTSERDDDVELLARARVVIGIGTGVPPEQYDLLRPLRDLLGAQFAATRKVTDRGWMPRSRQIGITGRSVAPRLYLALAVAGKLNHVLGVQGAGTIVAVNSDPSAPIFAHADVGLVGQWQEIVARLYEILRERAPGMASVIPAHP
jgi:electron transfer flavoprotein alpha subunit